MSVQVLFHSYVGFIRDGAGEICLKQSVDGVHQARRRKRSAREAKRPHYIHDSVFSLHLTLEMRSIALAQNAPILVHSNVYGVRVYKLSA